MDLIREQALDLTSQQFREVRDTVYEFSGLFFEEGKKYFVEKRVERRMEVLGVGGIDQYLRRLVTDPGRSEMTSLIEELTVNETYFFRNLPQLDGLSKKVLPKLIESKRRKNDCSLRMWSAACSTGEEAYTLAIIMREALPDIADWRTEVVVTDIDRAALRTAHPASY